MPVGGGSEALSKATVPEDIPYQDVIINKTAG